MNAFNRTPLAAAFAGALALCTLAGCKSSSRPDLVDPNASTSVQQIQHAATLVREARRYELAGDEKQAIAKYRAAINEYNELPVAWNNLGRLLMKNNENLGAAEAFKTASELSPTDPVPLYNLGALWESLGYLEDATRWYDLSLQRDEYYLPSLRRYLLVEDLRSKFDATTGDRLKHALQAESDPWWINRFKRMHQRYEESRVTAGADSVPR